MCARSHWCDAVWHYTTHTHTRLCEATVLRHWSICPYAFIHMKSGMGSSSADTCKRVDNTQETESSKTTTKIEIKLLWLHRKHFHCYKTREYDLSESSIQTLPFLLSVCSHCSSLSSSLGLMRLLMLSHLLTYEMEPITRKNNGPDQHHTRLYILCFVLLGFLGKKGVQWRALCCAVLCVC